MNAKIIFKPQNAVKILLFTIFLISAQKIPYTYAQQQQDVNFEEMRTSDTNTKNQRRVYNTSKHSSMSPAQMAKESTISESYGVFKIDGNFAGTVIKGRVFSDMGTGKQVESTPYTAMLNKKIKKAAIDEGVLVKEGSIYKKAKISKKEYDALINEVSKKTNISEKTVNDVIDNIED